MAFEIEYKFLVRTPDIIKKAHLSEDITQGYLSAEKSLATRVRIIDQRAWLTIKGANKGPVRLEFEYDIPVKDAQVMLDQLRVHSLIKKTRHHINHQAHQWVIDVFKDDNMGLITAEIELSDAHEIFKRPDWLGADITEDGRYSNAALSKHPFKAWA